MHWISLGHSCMMTFYLRKFGLQRGETHFFDWIVTSQKTVNEVLETKDIRSALENDIEFDEELFEGHKAFICKRFDLLRCVHDLPHDGDRPELFKKFFVDKYVRRYERLIELIRNQEPIVFVLSVKNYHEDDYKETKRLIQALGTHNPTLRYRIVLFVFETCTVYPDNIIIVPIKQYEYAVKPDVIHWYSNQYDWARMFQTVCQAINTNE